ncbi:hypothetical protein ACWDYH_15235 [Nocardia goodfellowii]
MSSNQDPLTAMDSGTVDKARLTVCRYAKDAGDAERLMQILGLLTPPQPQQQPPVVELVPEPGLVRVKNPGKCIECDEVTVDRRSDAPGRQYGARGRCSACYQRLIKGQRRKGAASTHRPSRQVAERSR